MDLSLQIQQLHVKVTKVREHYDEKVFVYLSGRTKNSRSAGLLQDLFYLKACLFALQEQLNTLESNCKTVKERVGFINDLFELDFSNEQIEALLKSKNVELLADKYHASALTEALRKPFDRNAEGLVRVLVEFVAKRKVYWKNENERLLDELVYLKSKLIKHLCLIEKLSSSPDAMNAQRELEQKQLTNV
uniref:Protein kinase interacting protein n=1 Tax=Lymantria dispar multicapsid nuclear polyhedrosis virus TaxID=10449 RepID=A0A1B1MR45_NPVLD|nr:protein kinase interacting protein [Lymantria dispar multiple nucleopolyhedrovirus]